MDTNQDKARLFLACGLVYVSDAKIWLDVYHKTYPVCVEYVALRRMMGARIDSDGVELALEARTRLVEMALEQGHDVVTELDGPEDVGYWHEIAQDVMGYRCPARLVLVEKDDDGAISMREVETYDLDDTEVCPECDGPASMRVGGKGTTRYYVTRCATCGDVPYAEDAEKAPR